MDIVLSKLRHLRGVWLAQQDRIVRLYQAGTLPTEDDMRIWLPGCNSIVDHGLGTNTGIFVYKLPDLLIQLWTGSYQDCVNLQQLIIDYQIRQSKRGGISDIELTYTIYVVNIIAWVLKHKYGCTGRDRRNVTSGNLKTKTHYTGGLADG